MLATHQAQVVLELIVINTNRDPKNDYKDKTKSYDTFGPETYFVIKTFFLFWLVSEGCKYFSVIF